MEDIVFDYVFDSKTLGIWLTLVFYGTYAVFSYKIKALKELQCIFLGKVR